MEIKIDKDVPVPDLGLYPFDQMEVGDSFVTPRACVRTAAAEWAKRRGNGAKFVCRRQPDGTFRIWRVA